MICMIVSYNSLKFSTTRHHQGRYRITNRQMYILHSLLFCIWKYNLQQALKYLNSNAKTINIHIIYSIAQIIKINQILYGNS